MSVARRAALIVPLVFSGLALAPQEPAVRVASSARALQPGEIIQFTITTLKPAEGVRLEMFGRAWPVARIEPSMWRALIGIDLDTTPRVYTAVVTVDGPEGQKPPSVRRSMTVVAKKFGTRTLTVDDAFVNPPADVEARIASESARLAGIWKLTDTPRAWVEPFQAPVPEAANSAFGKRSIFNGQVRNAHTGADFPSPAGALVAAPNAGTVILAQDLYFSGNTVILDHGLGLFSTFAHLSAMDVRAGDVVARGQRVGLVGATGRVTAAHLHWAVRLDGARVDPLSLVWVTARRAP